MALAALARTAHAGGFDLEAVGARAVGRAGAAVVSADDGAALWYNPAGLARRGGWRAQLGLGLAAGGGDYLSNAFADMAPTIEDRGAVAATPTSGLQGSFGERWVVGVAYLEPSDHAYDSATPFGDVVDTCGLEAENQQRQQYPHRYAGTQLRYTRRGAGLGAAVRALPWLAVGAAVLAFDVTLVEDRTISGLPGVGDEVKGLCTAYDMALTARGSDRLVPGVTLGMLVAPPDAPLELALSLAWSDDARLSGAPSLDSSRGYPAGRLATAAVDADAQAEATLALPLVARAGARFLGARFAVELTGELLHGAALEDWSVRGVTLTATDTGAAAPLTTIPAAAVLRNTWALRGAVDVDVTEGLTLTGGYAFRRGGVTRSSLTPALADLDTHTVAVGAEIRAGGATITVGFSHAFGVAVDLATTASRAVVLHPLAPGGDVPAAGGRYDTSDTLLGIAVELER